MMLKMVAKPLRHSGGVIIQEEQNLPSCDPRAGISRCGETAVLFVNYPRQRELRFIPSSQQTRLLVFTVADNNDLEI
jgi:hypothetical protein